MEDLREAYGARPLAWAGSAISITAPSAAKLEMSLFISPLPILRRGRGKPSWTLTLVPTLSQTIRRPRHRD